MTSKHVNSIDVASQDATSKEVTSQELTSKEVTSNFRLPTVDYLKLFLVGVLQGACTVASILIIRRVIDRLTSETVITDVLPLAYGFGGVAILLAISRGLEYGVSERMGFRKVAVLRSVLFAHLMDLPARSVQRSSQGALILRFTGDLSNLRTWISRGLGRGVIATMTLIGGMSVVFAIDLAIGFAVIGIFLINAAAAVVWGYRVRRTTRAVRWRRSLLASNVAEQIRSIAVVQTFGRARGELSRMNAQKSDLLGAENRSATVRATLRFFVAAAGSLAIAIVMIVGIFQIERQQLTVGGLVAAMTAVRFIVAPIRTIGRAYEYYQAAQVSKRKLADFLAREKRADVGRDLISLRPRGGRIEFRDVKVPGALNGVNLVIESGETIAIMGENGAGKSALLSTIARLVDPSDGVILMDDQNLLERNVRSTLRHVGMVSADLPLMRGTIRRNITYRYAHVSEDEIQYAIKSCGVDEILETIDGGLNAWVVEGGTNIPLGHRQRISLARATVGNPRILLLDEPTSNLDLESKEAFRRFIWRYRGTVVLVTHDPIEAALADHVCIMSDGRITKHMTSTEFRDYTNTNMWIEKELIL